MEYPKSVYHKEVKTGKSGRKIIIIDTAELSPGKYETMALNKRTGESYYCYCTHDLTEATAHYQYLLSCYEKENEKSKK